MNRVTKLSTIVENADGSLVIGSAIPITQLISTLQAAAAGKAADHELIDKCPV